MGRSDRGHARCGRIKRAFRESEGRRSRAAAATTARVTIRGRRRLTILLLVGLIGLSAAAPARADPGAASKFIRDLGAKAVAILRAPDKDLAAREAAFRGLLKEGFDLALIGRFALGRHWRLASAEQRQDYLSLFGEYVLRTYARKLGGYAGEKFVVVSETPLRHKADVLVSTRIERPKGPPIKTGWRVRTTQKRPLIIDVIVEGISLAVVQRDQFSTIVRRHGLDGLLESLRARSDKSPAMPVGG